MTVSVADADDAFTWLRGGNPGAVDEAAKAGSCP